MKSTRHLGFGLLLLLLAWAAPAGALPPFARYGPACQWIRLVGEVARPVGLSPDETIYLTVTYRLPDQKRPRTLMTNRPLSTDRFRFVLSGFREGIDGVIFIEPGFRFSKRVVFDYYATTSDRKWKSGWQRSVYRPERIKEAGESLCKTEIEFAALPMEAQ